MVVGEVLTREGAVIALGLIEQGDVRLDPALMHQPVQHLGRALAGVGNQPFRPRAEFRVSTLDHGLCGRQLGLTHGIRGLHGHDDGAFYIDQLGGAVGVDSRAAPRGGPACRWVDRRGELRLHRAWRL